MKTIVLLAGYAQCGKDTVANILTVNEGFYGFRFAKPIYAMVAAMYEGVISFSGVEEERMKRVDHPMPCSKLNFRETLQTLGTEWGRDNVGENIWVDLACSRIKNYMGEGSRSVIVDCRFVNEYTRTKELFPNDNVQLWYVSRPDHKPVKNNHRSELEQVELRELADRVIDNDSTLEDLKNLVLTVSGILLQ